MSTIFKCCTGRVIVDCLYADDCFGELIFIPHDAFNTAEALGLYTGGCCDVKFHHNFQDFGY